MTGWRSDWADVREEDIAKLSRQLSSGTLNVVSGGILARFEKSYAKFSGTAHALAVNSGTSALYSALHAVGVRAGDDVLMADYGFHGMAAAVLALGARVVVCDVEPLGMTLDPAEIERRRTPQTKAVLVHHPWGVPANLPAIRQATDLPVISDASHAHGALIDGTPLARFADLSCYSLGMGKLITGGELGCVATDHRELLERMMVLGHVNRVPKDLKELDWAGNAVGLKMRPHVAALMLAAPQLSRFAEKQALLRETAGKIEAAAVAAGAQLQLSPVPSERSYWRILLRWQDDLPERMAALREAGIPVEAHEYSPTLQHQSIFDWPEHQGRVLRASCPVAEREAAKALLLPAPVTLAPQILEELPQQFKQAVA